MRRFQSRLLAVFLFVEIIMANVLPAAGRQLNRASESCRLKAYLDPKGIPTIAWGHTGPDVHLGLIWTQAQADAAQDADLQTAENAVSRYVTVPLTDNQYGVLVDFAYNDGSGALQKSRLLRLINAGRFNKVPAELMLWVHCNGKIVPGLVTRAKARVALWNTPDAHPTPAAAIPTAPTATVAADPPTLLQRLIAFFHLTK